METQSSSPALPLKKKIIFILVSLVFLALLFAFGAEIIVRLKGVQPWTQRAVSIKVEPGGKFYMEHLTLGYSHIPGAFTVTLKDGYSFNVTQLPNTLRRTKLVAADQTGVRKEEIWIFGGSFTHGWSLNDEETYPWLIQARFPAYDVVNLASVATGQYTR